LIATIERYANTPFRYGLDCCAFVADCVAENTGKHMNFDYETEDEAQAIIDEYGSLEAAITSKLGEPCFGYEDGYVALVDTKRQQVAGIFHRGRILVRVANGLNDLPAHRAAKVWNPCHS